VGGTPRKKPGRPGLKGRHARRQEQRVFRAICREFNLDKHGQRTLHEAITGLGLSPDEIRERARGLFGIRRKKK
jgi:hypothetical protein